MVGSWTSVQVARAADLVGCSGAPEQWVWLVVVSYIVNFDLYCLSCSRKWGALYCIFFCRGTPFFFFVLSNLLFSPFVTPFAVRGLVCGRGEKSRGSEELRGRSASCSAFF